MLPCSEGNNYVWISIVSITTQSILYQLDCVRYYKIRQTIVLILRPSEHTKTSTSKCYISRSTCLKFNLKTVLNSDNHGGSNSKTAALIITLAKSVLSPLAAPLCTARWDNRWQNFSRPVVAQFSRTMASFSRTDLNHKEIEKKKMKKVSHGARKDILRCSADFV